MICTAGGWTGGSAADDSIVAATNQMLAVCLQPTVAAAHVAGKHLLDGGTVIVTGAAAALGSTPGMVAYGMAKAATHHLVHSMAGKGGGLPARARIFGLLPRTIDTPSNRKFMGDQDTSAWTPVDHLANKSLELAERRDTPGLPSGALLEAITSGGNTRWHVHTALYAPEVRIGVPRATDHE